MYNWFELSVMVIGALLIFSIIYWISEKTTDQPFLSFLITIPMTLIIVTIFSGQAHAVLGAINYWSRLPNSVLSVFLAAILHLLWIWNRLD